MAVNGRLIKVISQTSGFTIAGVRSDEISVTCDTIEVSSPSAYQWKKYITGRKSWSVQTGYLVGAEANIADLLNVGETYMLAIGSEGEGGTTIVGSAILDTCKINATINNVVSGSFKFVGNGALGAEAVLTAQPAPLRSAAPQQGVNIVTYDDKKVLTTKSKPDAV